MRMPYLRQLTQPLTGGVSALRPSRRWPMRADEQRVPVQASPRPPAHGPIDPGAVAAPHAREARQPDVHETGTPPALAPGPRPPLRLQLSAIRGLASPDLVTAPIRTPPEGPLAPAGAPSPPPSSHVPVARPVVVAEASAHHEAAAGHASAPGTVGQAKPTSPRGSDAPRPPESPRPKLTDAELLRPPTPHADASSPPESVRPKTAASEPSRRVDAPPRPEPLRSIASPAAAMLSSSVAAEPQPHDHLRFDRPEAPARSGAAAGPLLKIGTIEVRVAAASPPPGPPPAPAPPHGPRSPAAAPSRPTALSRGFASPFGLRQA
jgi:hypothetical protein